MKYKPFALSLSKGSRGLRQAQTERESILYRARSIGAVATDFGEAIALLAEQPGIGAKYIGSKTPGVRRLFLSRVKYFVYYQADEQNLNVLAF